MWRSLLRELRLRTFGKVFSPIVGIGFIALVAWAASPPARGAEAEAAGSAQFLMISDIHFDPMADPKLVNQLAAADPDAWQAILESSDTNGVSRYGKDSN
jgi:sphingomyelin phosphodiesterase acid-like 3